MNINTRPISRRCHATQKICSSGAEKILEVSLKTRLREGFIKKSELTWGNVSSIIQEKAIRDPTDVRLYDRLWERLVNLYVKRVFELQQTYERIEKRFCAAQTVMRKPISSGRREKPIKKLYSIHEMQVECIGKGKAHKKLEIDP